MSENVPGMLFDFFLLTLWSTKIKMNPTIPNNAARDNMILCAWNQPPPLTILPSPSATFFSTAALLILNSVHNFCKKLRYLT